MEYITLIQFAEKYETAEFLPGDPSWFMHQVTGRRNQEAIAFIASALSYGSRQQFMQKIMYIFEQTSGQPDRWVREGLYKSCFRADDKLCFYRLYTNSQMHSFLTTYRQLLLQYGSLGEYVRANAQTATEAISLICRYFNQYDSSGIIPKDTTSACKRLCMFLRWMVRTGSPVDLGLWSDFISSSTLIIPLDTHVLQQATRLGLIQSKTATMSAARRLTDRLREVFPDDPVKGDYALFGYGVNEK